MFNFIKVSFKVYNDYFLTKLFLFKAAWFCAVSYVNKKGSSRALHSKSSPFVPLGCGLSIAIPTARLLSKLLIFRVGEYGLLLFIFNPFRVGLERCSFSLFILNPYQGSVCGRYSYTAPFRVGVYGLNNWIVAN